VARIRALKPGFFKNHALFIAEKESGLPLRLAYEGLWCVADREGRFKWKPEEIKTDVLPYDDVAMGAVLDALVRYRFILKYKCAGEEYGFIPTFLEHQHVNKNEAPSTIPAPPKNSNARAKTVNAPKPPVVAPSKHHEELVSGVWEQEGKGTEVVVARASRSKSKSRLPDLCPSEKGMHDAKAFWAVHARFDLVQAIEAQADQFRDHHLKNGSLFADWDAAWRTWYRNALKFNRETKVSNHDKGTQGAALYLASLEAGDRAGLGDRTGEAVDPFPANGHGRAQVGGPVPDLRGGFSGQEPGGDTPRLPPLSAKR